MTIFVCAGESIDRAREATIQNLQNQGKKLDFLRYDDILVRKARKRHYCVILLHDISASMTDMIFFTNSIVSSLIQVFRNDELAIGLFGEDFYIMKEIDDCEDIDRLSSAILSLEAGGGTMLEHGIYWAEEQLKNISGEAEKVCFIISDFKLYSLQLAYNKAKELLQNDVKIIGISTGDTQNWRENVDNRIVDVSLILRNTRSPEDFLCKVLDCVFVNLFSSHRSQESFLVS